MKYAIETFDLTKKYKDFTAVNSLNMKIPNKSIFGMLGPNGAGKTTTIKMLTCLTIPTKGTATVGGYDINDNPNEVRKLLGMVPQQVSLYKDLTVKENAELCADFYGVPSDEKEDRINELMELVDISYAKDKRIGKMSGGQKQKASLVASLVHRPDILFLDEPTIGLVPTTKRVLWDLIQDLNDSGHTIILCSHDMHEVDMLCDNVGIISTGNLVAYDSPRALKDQLISSQKEEYTNLNNAMYQFKKDNKVNDKILSDSEKALEIQKQELFSYKEMSFLLKNPSDELLNYIKTLPYVHGLEVNKNGRISLKIDKFNDNAVTDILKALFNKGAIISSISTQEPSLEDVFIKTTSEADLGPRV